MVDLPTVRIAFDRPEVRNAFRPHTVDELYRALDHARMTPDVGCVLLTGNGPSPEGRRLGVLLRRRPADPRPHRLPVRRRATTAETVDPARRGRRRLHILEVQRLIRFMPKIVIAVVAGLGGRRRALPARRLRSHPGQPRARPFKQTDADVGSFDGGYGSAYLARMVGQKFAREIFFLGREYTAQECTGWAR